MKELFWVRQLLRLLMLPLLLFTVMRLAFYVYNGHNFPTLDIATILGVLGSGVRFDIAALAYINSIFILSYLLPFRFREYTGYQKFQKWIFITSNFLGIAVEAVDIPFFHFALRRSNISDLSLFKNSIAMIPDILAEYWYLILIFVILIWLFARAYDMLALRITNTNFNKPIQIILFFVGVGLMVLGMRGGWQLRPLSPSAAATYVSDMRLMPVVSNTTLSLIFSSQQRILKNPQYFNHQELNSVFSLYQYPKPDTAFQADNIVIVALESFGKEYSGLYNDYQGYMPFLDSLMQQGLSAKYSYANGLRSTQGIVSITSGIPALMEDPLMFSAYQSNRVGGIASLLQKKGYTSAFFHGANEGSMEFERFAKMTGFQYYFDRRHYHNDADYDGQWGIWDIPFLQYFANSLDTIPQPFLGFTFTLTSHHPYKTEKWFETLHPDIPPIYRSVLYTDYALRLFFQKAAQKKWFKNTLFVICADHIGASSHDEYETRSGKYKIPILYYKADGSLKGEIKNITQQIDILPSVMDYLHYDLPYTSFGRSIFNQKTPHYAYMYSENMWQIMDSTYILIFDGERSRGLYNYQKDSLLHENILITIPDKAKFLENQLKAAIQYHHKAMIDNQLVIK